MKINIFLSFLFLSLITQAQIVDIPDANFKYMLINHSVADFDGDGNTDGSVDTNNDNEIQVSEAEAVLGLNFFPIELINSLEGIEAFTNLEWLTILGHNIDVFDVSQNSNLKKLDCNSNNITSLLLPQNSNLLELSLHYNNIEELDVSEYQNLTLLIIDNNNLSEIDVTNNNNLEAISFYNNSINNIDLTNNSSLKIFGGSGNNIISLDLSNNPYLEYLYMENNPLIDINLSNNPNIISAFLVGNQLLSIDLSSCNNLESIYIGYNSLIELDLSNNPNLKGLFCTNNNLISLNIQNGNNINLSNLSAYDNPDLVCIQVDDEDWDSYPFCDLPFSNLGWCLGANVILSEDCEHLGVDENLSLEFKLYPNPTQDFLFIETQEFIETVKIYNLQGQLIKEASSNNIDVSQLSFGLYFVQVIANGKNETKKFVKN